MVPRNEIFPFYIKAAIFFVGLCAFIAILYIAQSIIVPLIFAFIIAILLNPVVNLFVRIKVNRVIAIIITLFLAALIIAAFCAFMFSQFSLLSESWPKLVEKFTVLINQFISSLSDWLNIKPYKMYEWINKTRNEIINSGSAIIGRTLLSLGSAIALMLLVPVYVFVILYYKPLLLEFIQKLFSGNDKLEMDLIVRETETIIQHYLMGILIEVIIMTVLEAATLLILGIEYAILLGIIGALVNIIPYIGGLVGVAIPMMVALVTKDSAWYAVYILIAFYLIQLFDNNYIVPIIVASKVKINALFSIVVVLVGNSLWGISGMFLSIPMLAIMKVIFDHIDSLKPWGYLLGDTMPEPLSLKDNLKKVYRKKMKNKI